MKFENWLELDGFIWWAMICVRGGINEKVYRSSQKINDVLFVLN